MKVIPFQVPSFEAQLCRVQIDQLPHFYDNLHQHPEIQITLIEQGEGVLVAGDYLGDFAAGDVFVLGSGLPHVFRSERAYFEPDSSLSVRAITVFFDDRYWGDTFWLLNELQPLRAWCERATAGFSVRGLTQQRVAECLQQIGDTSGLDKVLLFFEMLKVLVQSSELVALSMAGLRYQFNETENKRMSQILQFTFRESHRPISIAEVAHVANLSPEAFCRYFKVRTRKTYINFLNEVRINNSLRLLGQSELPIAAVAEAVGFPNLSNFNRVFKRVTGHTPRRVSPR